MGTPAFPAERRDRGSTPAAPLAPVGGRGLAPIAAGLSQVLGQAGARPAVAAAPSPRPSRRKGGSVGGRDAVEAGRRLAKEAGFLVSARAAREALGGVPVSGVGVRALVDREVALEHAPLGPEGLDARLDVGAPGSG